jgi:energy-coupling factor transporter ATP-binding protein EcfA2
VAFRVMKNTVDDRTKHQAMAMIKECNTTTMDLVSNQGMIDGAMKYVEEVCKRMSGKLMAATESSAAATSSTPITTNPPAALVLENQRVHETVNFVVRNEQTGEERCIINPSLF